MKVKESPKAQTNNTTYMSDKAFAALRKALEEALAFECGQRRDLQVTRIQATRSPKSNVTKQ
jgi:hypothetical protein